MARVREGTPPRQAQEELAVLVAREGQAEPQFEGFTPQLERLTEEMNRDGRRILVPLLGAAALVLLIGCGNAAALLLVRGLQRQQEYAVRGALGMGRVALFRQVLAEGLLLVVAQRGGRATKRHSQVGLRRRISIDRGRSDRRGGTGHDFVAGADIIPV